VLQGWGIQKVLATELPFLLKNHRCRPHAAGIANIAARGSITTLPPARLGDAPLADSLPLVEGVEGGEEI